jgi:hypothetical protein
MERVGDRQGKMERYCSTGQSPQQTVVPMEEEEEEEEDNDDYYYYYYCYYYYYYYYYYFKNSAILYIYAGCNTNSYVGIIQSSLIVMVFI